MRRSTLVLAGVVLGTLATSMLGQQPADPAIGHGSEVQAEAGSFGSDGQYLWVDAVEFVPHLDYSWRNWAEGYRYIQTAPSAAELTAPIGLPAGARITAISCYFYDTHAENALVSLFRSSYNIATNTPGGSQIGGFIQSFGTIGYQRVTLAYDETVRHQEGNLASFYSLSANMPAGNALRLRGCRIVWNRQVSPAPATATFADVPVGHPYHRFVQALVDANITAGCGGGLFCVNAPVTRGEMAVFIAVALGLHFPF